MRQGKSCHQRMCQRQRSSLLSSSIPGAATIVIAVLGAISTPCFGINIPWPPAFVRDDSPPPLRGSSSAATQRIVSVEIAYDVPNECGLSVDAVMNEEGNGLKEGLIAATEAILSAVLEDEYPENNNAAGRRHSKRNAKEEEVHYSDDYPIVIDRIFSVNDILKIYSTIRVVAETNGNDSFPRAVQVVVSTDMHRSFDDGSFFRAIPEGALICNSS